MQVCLRLHAYSPPAEPKAGVYDSIYIMQPLETKTSGSMPEFATAVAKVHKIQQHGHFRYQLYL